MSRPTTTTMTITMTTLTLLLLASVPSEATPSCLDRWATIQAATALVGHGPLLDAPSNLVALVSDEVAFEAAGCIGVVPPPPQPPPPPPTGSCGLQLGSGTAAFCETFETAFAVQDRMGELNPAIWGVSRAIGGGVNPGQGLVNEWPKTDLQACSGTVTVNPPNDVVICNGQLREASSDNTLKQHDGGDVTVLAMYPKQPFDFAGRTGTVAFDVSNDSHGTHAAWPEFWITDTPVPAPFTFQGGWKAVPQHGLGIRFAAAVTAGNYGFCNNNDPTNRWTVDSAVVIRNYVIDDSFFGWGTVHVTPLTCVTSPTGPDQMNHVEIQVAQNQLDVYATDAGTIAPLKHIATVTGANLSFTRGLVWLEDVHYNADKMEELDGRPTQRDHTFAWDNVAFDGPFTYHDLSYDAPNNTQAARNGAVNLGKASDPNQAATWIVPGLPASATAAAVRVLFNFWSGPPPATLSVTVNGHAHSVAWPYPDVDWFSWRTMAVTIPQSDLVAGSNTVLIGSPEQTVSANVNLVLVNATVP